MSTAPNLPPPSMVLPHSRLVPRAVHLREALTQAGILGLTALMVPVHPLLATLTHLALQVATALHQPLPALITLGDRHQMLLSAMVVLGGAATLGAVSFAFHPDFLPFCGIALFGLGLRQVIFHLRGAQAVAETARRDSLRCLERERAHFQLDRATIQAAASQALPALRAAQIAHDMASPLQVIISNLGLLQEAHQEAAVSLSAAEINDLLQRSQEAAARLRLGIQAQLERPELERRPPQLQATLLARDAVAGAQRKVRDQGLHPAEVSIEMAEGTLYAHPDLVRILSNIVANGAVRSSDGPVTLRGVRLGPWFYGIEVRDHGVRGPAQLEAHERVRATLADPSRVNPNFRTGLTVYGAPRGFGIGLALAQRQLLLSNGWLGVRIPDEGPGLVFQVVLPTVPVATIPTTENRPWEAWHREPCAA